ncbi:MAG: RNA polymerase sigma factor [Gammaproteobacteria bacterium]
MRGARPIPKPREGGPLARWFAEHGARLRNWLGRRVGCPETAADLAQEACVRLARCAATRGEEQLRGLAYRIANQVLIDHHRRTAIRARVEAQASDLGAIASPAPGPEQVLAGRQALARLREALADLPVDCRTAFLLQGLDGLSYAQIASRLGISERMVAKHLARAMRHCRDRIASD